MASWNAVGICFNTTPGTPSGPAALWFGVRRRASWNIAGVIFPISMGSIEVGLGLTWVSHGKGTPIGNVGSGERAVVSNWVRCSITSLGEVRI